MAARIPKCDTCKIGYGAIICYDCNNALFYSEDPVKKAAEEFNRIDRFIKRNNTNF